MVMTLKPGSAWACRPASWQLLLLRRSPRGAYSGEGPGLPGSPARRAVDAARGLLGCEGFCSASARVGSAWLLLPLGRCAARGPWRPAASSLWAWILLPDWAAGMVAR